MKKFAFIKSDEVKVVMTVILFGLWVVTLIQWDEILDNQRDIDRRLTRIEQNECVVDSTLVDLYQRNNESLWIQMLMSKEIKQLWEKNR